MLSASWSYLAFGEGNIPWKVRELIKRVEPDPGKAAARRGRLTFEPGPTFIFVPLPSRGRIQRWSFFGLPRVNPPQWFELIYHHFYCWRFP